MTNTSAPDDARRDKAAARSRIRGRRRARPESERAEAAVLIAAGAMSLLTVGTSTIACYVSLPTEPRTDPLIEQALSAGHVILVPRIRGSALDWVRLDDSTAYVSGPMGIREPTGDAIDAAALADLAVMFVPGLAVDRTGRRLGQGGGFYDRVLAGVPVHARGGPLLVALLFADEILDDVPVEAHDCTVDAALTPAGITRFRKA
jgi:5-formyltetrahydrofolate cyclo-ligase